MSFCIFIASRTATTSPSFTSSPVLTGTLTIRPCIGAITVPSPVRGGGGAEVAGAVEATPAPGATVMPAPLTRTLNTSPSTSTSNSADALVEGAGAGGAGGGVLAAGAGGSVATTGACGDALASGAGPRKKSGVS